MRLISFALTKAQVRARTKTQTRRVGWADAKVGEVLYVDEPSVTDRFMAGESVEAIAADLQRGPAEIEAALRRGTR